MINARKKKSKKCKKIRDTKGTFHAKKVTVKDINVIDLTEAEDIKKSGMNTLNYTKKSS